MRQLDAIMQSELLPLEGGEQANNHPVAPIVYSLYGADPAYPHSHYLFGGYRNPRAGTLQAQWNTEVSKVREVVEWGFASILANWAFLEFRPAMKIFKSPIGKYYTVTAFLMNLHTCFYGNQTMAYFDCAALTQMNT